MKRYKTSPFAAVRRPAVLAVAAVAAVSAVAACSSSGSSSTAAGGSSASTGTSASTGASAAPAATGIKKGLTVYFIPKDTQNPYEVLADAGGTKALAALGGKVVVSSGTADTAAAQIPSIQAAIQAHADAIVIAGNDPSALCPSLQQASSAGIKILSFDSDVSCGSSPDHLFVNQADTASIGTSEVDILAKEIGSSGQIAILS
ncbi:MAG TPA: substrate-binding domain-containing protein, partial [Trebonia sp.]